MILELASVIALASRCAPSVAPETLISLVHTESRFNTLAIGVNARGFARPDPKSVVDAISHAKNLIARGVNIDLGLGQINSANLSWLGLSVEEAFEPCKNLAASAHVLSDNYAAASRYQPAGDQAISVALSLYNTGDRSRGFRNGYVGRVYASSAIVIPAMRAQSVSAALPSAAIAKPRPLLPASPSPVTSIAAPQSNIWNISAGGWQAPMMVFGSSRAPSNEGISQ